MVLKTDDDDSATDDMPENARRHDGPIDVCGTIDQIVQAIRKQLR
jgi:hypothetical protein